MVAYSRVLEVTFTAAHVDGPIRRGAQDGRVLPPRLYVQFCVLDEVEYRLDVVTSVVFVVYAGHTPQMEMEGHGRSYYTRAEYVCLRICHAPPLVR